ncbi:MAG: hypothetical protein WD669_02975 [Pirellulales bacterium]
MRIRSTTIRCLRTVLPLLIVALVAGVAAACPTCREGLAENDPQGNAIAAGFFYSILFMMSVPYAILATFGGVAYFSIRRARARQSLATAAENG